MLDLSTENKTLCFEDSTRKPLYIFIYYFHEDRLHQNGGWWQYFTTIDEAIVMESMELDEGVLEGNNFELGSFVVPSMKVQWQNNGIRYKDMVAVPVQKIGNEYIACFDGYISSEEISQDGQTVSAEIVSFIGERLDIDVLETVKGYSGGTLYEIIQSALSQTAGIWVYGSETDELLNKFKNANTIINLNTETLPQTLTANQLLKQAGEFLGGHIVVKEKRIVDIDDMTSYQPSTMPIIDFIRFSNVDTVAQSNIKPLPSGYKRLEYIQSNGTQYIDTNFIPTENPRIVMTAKITSDNNIDLFGSGDNVTPTWRLNIEANQETGEANFYYRYYSTDRVVVPYNRATLLNKKCIYDIGESIVINGKNYYTFAENYDFSTFTKSIKIFGSNDGFESSMILYDCKIYNGDTLVRDFVPALNSNGVSGLYDFVENKFYASETSSRFVAPNPIETYTLPYYINLYADKTNRVKFDQIRVLTETGDTQSGQRNYTHWWNNDVKTTYEIKNNIFFESLSTQYWQYCSNAVREVGSYLAEQNLYYTDLKTVYPPFIEGGDYLVVKGKNQSKLPVGYSSLEYIEIKKETAPYITGIITNVMPDSNNIEIDIDFSFNSNESVIFEADAKDVNETILMLSQYQGALTCYIGNWYIGGAEAFQIPYAPKNQKLNLKIRCGNGRYEYNGTFSGNGTYNGDDVIHTKTNDIMLGTSYGRNTDFELYHFSYSQGGTKLCDMYPCMRESDGAIGVYDTVQNVFRVVQGNPNPNYESAGIIVPVLSTKTKGIHSIRADIQARATNVKN